MSPEVAVYGASGYSGKRICGKLAERRIPFVAAGRSVQALTAELARVPALAEDEPAQWGGT